MLRVPLSSCVMSDHTKKRATPSRTQLARLTILMTSRAARQKVFASYKARARAGALHE